MNFDEFLGGAEDIAKYLATSASALSALDEVIHLPLGDKVKNVSTIVQIAQAILASLRRIGQGDWTPERAAEEIRKLQAEIRNELAVSDADIDAYWKSKYGG